jgi:AcrR family transcriptional regulator
MSSTGLRCKLTEKASVIGAHPLLDEPALIRQNGRYSASPRRVKTEDALLRAAESLLDQGWPNAVTTRAVCDAANVGAPTLYHHYRDKYGLLDALVAKGVKTFLKRKQAGPDTDDAVADLISGWESFVGFALERPQLFRLMVQRVGDNPQIVDAATARTNARLIRLADEKRLTTDVAFARQSLLALSHGVTALVRQGASKAEVKAVGRFLLDATLSALVRTKRP